ncbi:IclR family transcriptional regulator [Pontivivens insulae]|uniref:Transcriptional regulator KdgR n=1 Tax=Pontivivens insulae TaxID=1639689 RepID=A0A2R8A7Q5_9RHOB|nr:IclR family transcriptional regulator [Pontivivens insulae]RED18365.1 IclR family transcriptional regulator [Pontivivens insulae]SPF28263.1 Transcriptional regulator KdgR [Pontivivens insulae]
MARSAQSSIVTKCAEVLDVISKARRPLGFAEIVERTGFVKSSCHRILAVLQSEDMISYDKPTRTYQTGNRVKRWARFSWHRTDLLDVAAGPMDSLNEDAGMNTALSILDDQHILYLRTSDHIPIRLADRAGDRAPLHCTAAGKVLLAHLSPRRRSDLLESLRLEKFTEYTVTDRSALEAEFPDIIEQGYARAICEEHLHVMGMGAPIWNGQKQVTACLSLWTATDDATKAELEQMAPKLVSAAQEISRQLGWEG